MIERHLKLVPQDFETPIVTEIRPPKPKLDWSHIRALGSLPDNVYMIKPLDEPEPAA